MVETMQIEIRVRNDLKVRKRVMIITSILRN